MHMHTYMDVKDEQQLTTKTSTHSPHTLIELEPVHTEVKTSEK